MLVFVLVSMGIFFTNRFREQPGQCRHHSTHSQLALPLTIPALLEVDEGRDGEQPLKSLGEPASHEPLITTP